jgi:hypothetical protein
LSLLLLLRRRRLLLLLLRSLPLGVCLGSSGQRLRARLLAPPAAHRCGSPFPRLLLLLLLCLLLLVLVLYLFCPLCLFCHLPNFLLSLLLFQLPLPLFLRPHPGGGGSRRAAQLAPAVAQAPLMGLLARQPGPLHPLL